MSIATHNIKTVPLFPNFVPINLSHKTVIDSLNGEYDEPNSDLNFVSLWGYMHVGCELSRLKDCIIFKLIDYHNGSPYLSLVGRVDSEEVVNSLMTYTKENNFLPYIRSIHSKILTPEVCESISKEYDIQKDPDYFDYIIDISISTAMLGRSFSARRKEISSFKNQNPDFVFRQLDLTSESERKVLFSLFEKWETQNLHKVTASESVAFKRVMEHSKYLNVSAFGIYIGGALIAFIVAERLNKDYIMFHYGKTDRDFRNGTSMLVYLLMEFYKDKGYKYINLQQDLGIEGLRKYKHLWRPAFFTEKFIIKPKVIG